jgi:hypothetical protein
MQLTELVLRNAKPPKPDQRRSGTQTSLACACAYPTAAREVSAWLKAKTDHAKTLENFLLINGRVAVPVPLETAPHTSRP